MLDLHGKVARLACGAVANAAEDSATHSVLLSRTNAMHYMVFLMRSRHLSVHREASRACGNLLTNRDAHKDFISEVGHRYRHQEPAVDASDTKNDALQRTFAQSTAEEGEASYLGGGLETVR